MQGYIYIIPYYIIRLQQQNKKPLIFSGFCFCIHRSARVLYLLAPIIALHLDASSYWDAPYTYDNKPYMRIESTTVVMSRDIFEDRLMCIYLIIYYMLSFCNVSKNSFSLSISSRGNVMSRRTLKCESSETI